MDWQMILVAAVVIFAILSVGRGFMHKAKAFSPKNDCGGADCGCDSPSTENAVK